MTSASFDVPRHPIQVASGRTGLTADVLRAWERRYRAVVPTRTDSGRRLYSDSDIERLLFLKEATQAGRSIGQVAALSRDELASLVNDDRTAARPNGRRPDSVLRIPGPGVAGAIYEDCLEAVADLDAPRLRAALSAATIALSQPAIIDHVIIPVMLEIGERWRRGTLRIAHEHVATAAVQAFLGDFTRAERIPNAPSLTIFAPAGQRHQLGAMMVASSAIAEGWNVTYLGADIRIEEVVAVCQQTHADAVAVSLTYPGDDNGVSQELIRLREMLPQTPILVGGRSAPGYAPVIERVGGWLLHDLQTMRSTLEQLRTKKRPLQRTALDRPAAQTAG